MQADFKNHFVRVCLARPWLQIEGTVGGFQPAGIGAQLWEDGGESLFSPVPGETALHGMNLRSEAKSPLKK